MAFNLKEMTVDYKKLLRMVPTERAAAAESGLLNDIIGSLTPGQMVNLFPRYYREQLPDVGQVNKYSSRLDVALSGGSKLKYTNNNQNYAAGPSLDQMKTELMKKGINVDDAYETVGEGVLENDPRVKYMKSIPTAELAEMGFQRTQDEYGKTLIKAIPTKASAMSDQEVSDLISGKLVANNNASENQKAVLDFANRWNISPEAAAGVLHIESGVTGNATNGNYHGVFQLGTDQVGPRSADAGFGKLTPAEFRQLSVKDQLKVMDEYYKFWKVEPGFFTGDPKTDAAKMWALQLAPGNAKKIDYTNPNAVISATDQASSIEARNGLVTVGSSSAGSVEQGIGYLGESVTRIQGNATTDQIKAARERMSAQEMAENENKLAKSVYGRENPYAGTATLVNTSGIMNPVGGSQEGTSILDPNAVPRSGGAPMSRSFGGPRAGGKYHTGVDLPGQVGDPVRAPADGTIRQIYKSDSGYGYVMDIEFPDGTVHRYAHLGTDTGGSESAFAKGPDGKPLKVGDKVKSGQTFGFVGESGNAGYEFPHVHMEVIKKDDYEETGGRPPGREETKQSLVEGRIDPFEWYKQQEERLKEAEAAKKAKATPGPVTNATPSLPPESKVEPTMTAPAVDPGTITPPPAPPPPPPPPEQMRDDRANPELKNKAQVTPPPLYEDMYMDMAGGDNKAPPSQYRAFNTARLYEPNSTRLVNGHFA